MAADLTNIMAKILARGLLSLRELAMMPQLCNTDYSDEAAQKGATIDVPVAPTLVANDVTPAQTYGSAQDATPGLVQITLANWKSVPFDLSDKQLVEIDERQHFLPLATSAALRALANKVDNSVLATYTDVYGYVGTAGTTPFSTVSDATDARATLNAQLAPMNDRRMLLDPYAEGKALQNSMLADLEKTGDLLPKIEGRLGRKYGFDWYMSQNIVSHVAGTAAALTGWTITSTTASGASSIGMSGSSATGTLVVGDVFAIAGQTGTYTVTRATSLASGATNTQVGISPPLRATATAAAGVSVKASHVVNLAFQREAFALAIRPLRSETDQFALGTQIMSASDPVSGIPLRLEVSRQYKKVRWEFDILWGAKCVRPELATRVAG